MAKVRRIDFSPDEFMIGMIGLSPHQYAVFWTACCIQYSTGNPVSTTDERLTRVSGVRAQHVGKVINSLIELKKLRLVSMPDQEGAWVSNDRVVDELLKARKRIDQNRLNGPLGGRPSKKNKDLENPDGFEEKTLTINYQPSTTNHQPDLDLNSIEPEHWRAMVSRFNENPTTWNRRFGPPPDSEGTFVPAAIRLQFGYTTAEPASLNVSRETSPLSEISPTDSHAEKM